MDLACTSSVSVARAPAGKHVFDWGSKSLGSMHPWNHSLSRESLRKLTNVRALTEANKHALSSGSGMRVTAIDVNSGKMIFEPVKKAVARHGRVH